MIYEIMSRWHQIKVAFMRGRSPHYGCVKTNTFSGHYLIDMWLE